MVADDVVDTRSMVVWHYLVRFDYGSSRRR